MFAPLLTQVSSAARRQLMQTGCIMVISLSCDRVTDHSQLREGV
jgi:hypothetical protein